jgi:hypothetical protein
MEKKCFKCGEIKSLNDFYKHNGMKDGHLNKCISCTKSDVHSYYKVKRSDVQWIEKEKARGRDKYYRLGYRGKYDTPSYKNNASFKSLHRKLKSKGYIDSTKEDDVPPENDDLPF